MNDIKLIDREREMAILNAQLAGSSSRRKSAFVMMYGRRRIGKSTLLKAWAQRSGRRSPTGQPVRGWPRYSAQTVWRAYEAQKRCEHAL